MKEKKAGSIVYDVFKFRTGVYSGEEHKWREWRFDSKNSSLFHDTLDGLAEQAVAMGGHEDVIFTSSHNPEAYYCHDVRTQYSSLSNEELEKLILTYAKLHRERYGESALVPDPNDGVLGLRIEYDQE